MRFLIAVLAVLGMTIAAGAVVPVAAADSGYVLALEQQPEAPQPPEAPQQPQAPSISVDITESGGDWWANPVWIGVGIVALILLVVIVAMATRGGGGTTIVKD